jgi:hypothetical protein
VSDGSVNGAVGAVQVVTEENAPFPSAGSLVVGPEGRVVPEVPDMGWKGAEWGWHGMRAGRPQLVPCAHLPHDCALWPSSGRAISRPLDRLGAGPRTPGVVFSIASLASSEPVQESAEFGLTAPASVGNVPADVSLPLGVAPRLGYRPGRPLGVGTMWGRAEFPISYPVQKMLQRDAIGICDW